MGQWYVLDTNGLIAYFSQVFQQPKRLSTNVHSLVSEALYSRTTSVRLTIPSVVFVEIFEKWLTTNSILRQFYYEVFLAVQDSPNIEIRAIEMEVLEALLGIGAELEDHDIHDKIILASALALKVQLITSDSALRSYLTNNGFPPPLW